MLLPRPSVPCLSIASQCNAPPLLRWPTQLHSLVMYFHAFPPLCASRLNFSVAIRLQAKLCPCYSNAILHETSPLLLDPKPFPCSSRRNDALAVPSTADALPNISIAIRGHSFPLRVQAKRSPCCSWLACSFPSLTFPPSGIYLSRCCATGRCRKSGHNPSIPGPPSRDHRRGRQR